jgi:hypothetical protein
VSVASGATLTIGANAAVTIADQQYLSDSGQLNVNGATVTIDKNINNGGVSDGIAVNQGGTMAVTGSTFNHSNG